MENLTSRLMEFFPPDFYDTIIDFQQSLSPYEYPKEIIVTVGTMDDYQDQFILTAELIEWLEIYKHALLSYSQDILLISNELSKYLPDLVIALMEKHVLNLQAQ